jgi:hypothetical protein
LLNFFRVNDPFRLIGIGIYLLLLTLVYLLFNPFPITSAQLIWLILGERVGDGYLLYKDIIDDTGPLAAGFFMLMDLIFGRSLLAHELTGRILIVFQILYWNSILIKFRSFDENTYLPAIIMAALFHFSFDMLSLSPALLASCFLILALGQLFSQTVLQKEGSESTLLIGVYAGIATGFQPNYLLFLPYLILTGITISGFSFRQLMLSLIGYFLPLMLIGVFYFWTEGLVEAIEIWPLSFLSEKYYHQSRLDWLMLGAFPIVLAAIGYFVSTIMKASTINQQKQRQLVILWLIFAAFEFLIIKRQGAFQLVIFIPVLTYLISLFYIYFRSGIIANGTFLLLILAFPAFTWWFWHQEITGDYFVRKSTNQPEKSLMVLGNDLSHFQNSNLGGPFLNYNLSRVYLEQERGLPEQARIYQMLQVQKSEVVLDPNGEFKRLLEQFPPLQDDYKSTKPGVFKLKN